MSGYVVDLIDRDGVVHQGYSFKDLYDGIFGGKSHLAELLSNMIGFIIKEPAKKRGLDVFVDGRARFVDCDVANCTAVFLGVMAPDGKSLYDSEGRFHEISNEIYYAENGRMISARGRIARAELYDVITVGSMDELRAEFISRMGAELSSNPDDEQLASFWERVDDSSFWAAVEDVLSDEKQ